LKPEGILSHSLKTLSKAPWHFFWLQFPAATIELVEKPTTAWLETHPVLTLLICLPYFFTVSILSTALTFSSVLVVNRNENPTFLGAFQTIKQHSRALVLAALLVGTVCALGMIALVIPGLYFTAVYLFVPHLILSDGKNPVMVYLHRSKLITKKVMLKTFSIVVSVFLASLVVFFAGETLGTWMGGLAHSDSIRSLLLAAVKMSLAMLTGAVIDVGICYYFLRLQKESHP